MTIDDQNRLLLRLRDAAIPKIRERAGSGLWSDYQYATAVRMLDNELIEWVNKNGIDHPQRQDAIDSILASIFSIMEN
jgi:hypothetical protein